MTRRDDSTTAPRVADQVAALHAEVDTDCGPLFTQHADRLECRLGCNDCCSDDLTVFEAEALHIRAAYGELLKTAEPHPVGACAFLGQQGECRIYAARPYVCRTQGLPLRYFVEDEAGDVIEQRSICSLNESGPPIEGLGDEDCWLIGPVEHRLIGLQALLDDEGVGRVALRELFETG